MGGGAGRKGGGGGGEGVISLGKNWRYREKNPGVWKRETFDNPGWNDKNDFARTKNKKRKKKDVKGHKEKTRK